MSLNIKSQEAERLARELAGATGESLTHVVTTALRERLDRLEDRSEMEIQSRAARIRKISKDSAPRWSELYRHSEHDRLLYDERGLPR
jgi:antitoxin VapB